MGERCNNLICMASTLILRLYVDIGEASVCVQAGTVMEFNIATITVWCALQVWCVSCGSHGWIVTLVFCCLLSLGGFCCFNILTTGITRGVGYPEYTPNMSTLDRCKWVRYKDLIFPLLGALMTHGLGYLSGSISRITHEFWINAMQGPLQGVPRMKRSPQRIYLERWEDSKYSDW